MKKLIIDGKVAVLVSPGFGAGWSTWLHNEEAIFDTTLVEFVLASQWDEAYQYAEEIYGYEELENLVVVWVPVGAQFRICENDGYEYIELKKEVLWITA
jgi:hypothetical protein